MAEGLYAAKMLLLSGIPLEDNELLALTPSDMGAIIEIENIVCLAACSLDTHPGKSNWVEKNGGLPNYICEIAKGILDGKRDQTSISRAISIAVGRCKVWAVSPNTKPDTKAKAAAAVAEWEKLKAKAGAKKAAKTAKKASS